MSGYHIALIRIWGSRTRFFSENINNITGFNLKQTQYFSKSGPVESYMMIFVDGHSTTEAGSEMSAVLHIPRGGKPGYIKPSSPERR